MTTDEEINDAQISNRDSDWLVTLLKVMTPLKTLRCHGVTLLFLPEQLGKRAVNAATGRP